MYIFGFYAYKYPEISWLWYRPSLQQNGKDLTQMFYDLNKNWFGEIILVSKIWDNY